MSNINSNICFIFPGMHRYTHSSKRNASSSNDDPLEGTSTGSSPQPSPSKYSLPYILDGEFFEPLTVDEIADRVTARCQTCHKIINGSGRSTGNWRSHINRLHPELIDRVNLKSINRKTSNLTSPGATIAAKGTSTNPLAPTLLHFKAIDTNAVVKEYIINEMIPAETIDSPHFITMLTTLTRGLVNRSMLINGQRLQQQLDQDFIQVKERLINMLAKLKNYCLTVDTWKYQRDKYLGLTVHAIEPSAYERLSYMLVYRKFNETNPFETICDDFGLQTDKLTSIITNNFTNLPKNNEFEFQNYPIHFEKTLYSASHILQQILDIPLDCILDAYTKETTTTLANEQFKVPGKCFKKLINFWDLLKETESEMKIKKFLNSTTTSTNNNNTNINIISPKENTGLNLYNAIKFLLNIEEAKFSELFEHLNLLELKMPEIEFLKEYIQIYEIFNSANDVLDNDKNNFLGVILPTFVILEYKLKCHKSKYCEPLINLIQTNMKLKFPYLDFSLESSKKFILASISYPKFKLWWIPSENQEYCQKLFIQECKEMYIQEQHLITVEDDQSSVADDEFFRILSDMNNKKQIGNNSKNNNPKDNLLNLHYSQALSYFEDNRKLLDMLDNYNIIKKVFIKYNTCLATSRNVQKIFCKNNRILTPIQSGIDENLFENMLFLRSNTTII